MAWEHLVARRFAQVLRDPDFRITDNGPYTNDYGIPGWRFVGSRAGRSFYVSQSRTTAPPSPRKVASILSNGDNIDVKKAAIYRNRDLEEGLRVEAWYGSQWFQVFTPDNATQPDDEFRKLLIKICHDRQKGTDDFTDLEQLLDI
ncbi:MAG: hypothetical protein ABSA70_03625 [Terriglobia bacterium]